MPYIDFESADDYASIFYTTNTLQGNVGGFVPSLPTIVMLHPAFLDSTWLSNQFGDPRINDHYNLISFDMRVCGRSSSRPSGRHDTWVEAADLAFCFQTLNLPVSHVLALDGNAANCALRFAVLFPEFVSSLCLHSIPPPTELKWVFNAFDEIMQTCCYANDLESFEHACGEAFRFLVGPDCGPELQDEVIEYWEYNMNPRKRTRMVEQINLVMNRIPLTSDILKSISTPILVIHGDRNEICPMKYAEKLVSDLVNAEGGAILYKVKGGSNSLSIVPGHASIANQVFCKFLSRLPKTRSDLIPPKTPIRDRMAMALSSLAELRGDANIATRDPMSSLSFCCLSADAVKSQTESLLAYRKGELEAFLPLGLDGRPIRKYSERMDQHWFQGGTDGLSYAGSVVPHGQKQELEYREKQLPLPHSDPIAMDVAIQGRPRRTTVLSSGSVDRHVIKGSMAKVVSHSSQNTIARMINV